MRKTAPKRRLGEGRLAPVKEAASKFNASKVAFSTASSESDHIPSFLSECGFVVQMLASNTGYPDPFYLLSFDPMSCRLDC